MSEFYHPSKSELMKQSIAKRRAEGRPIGRPRRRNDELILELRNKGLSLRAIAQEVGMSRTTVLHSLQGKLK